MSPFGSAQVVINTRTLRIGGQTYSLGNIARVQVVKLAKPPRADKGNVKLAVLAGFGAYIFVAIIASSVGLGAIGGILGLPGILAIGLGIFIYQKTKEPYIQRYALMLETTGNPRISLVSDDEANLEKISVPIIEAMENPPETEQVYTVNNVISGDQYNLVGDHNVGKSESRV
jgi:Family of unknown function (DUF6232)